MGGSGPVGMSCLPQYSYSSVWNECIPKEEQVSEDAAVGFCEDQPASDPVDDYCDSHPCLYQGTPPEDSGPSWFDSLVQGAIDALRPGPGLIEMTVDAVEGTIDLLAD
jgi:hypothetical protein